VLFADINAEGWVLIIGAVSLLLSNLATLILSMVLQYLRDKATAVKVEAVKAALEATTEKHTGKLDNVALNVKYVERAFRDETAKQNEILGSVAAGVAEVKEATNGLISARLKEAREASFALGEKSEAGKHEPPKRS